MARSLASRQHVRAALVAWLALAGVAIGHGAIPRDAPVDRLVTNLTKYLKDHPDDPEAHYRLGRVHTLALETKTEFVLAFGGEESVRPAEGSWAKRDWERTKEPGKATPEQLKTHLAEAIRHLNKAIEMRPAEPRYRLTLACALEAGESMLDDVDAWPLCPVPKVLEPALDEGKRYLQADRDMVSTLATDPSAVGLMIEHMRDAHWRGSTRDAWMTLAYERRDQPAFKEPVRKLRRADWHEQIEEQYFTAMCFALPANGKASEKPIWGGMEDWASYEAGQNFIRVVEARGARPNDAIRLKSAKATVKAFDDLPHPNAITPIVLDLHGRLLSGLQTASTTRFDLDGSGRPQSWTWVTADAGILVWDPTRSGRITSGRQLFGSASWRVNFDNGYQALDALDDDRDGELAGAELDGISVWFDRDGNGVAGEGEVVPVYQLGVVAISCRATAAEGSSPVNLAGVRMDDGRLLPSYDWMATAVPERQASGHGWIAPLVAVLAAVPLLSYARRRRF